MGLPQRATTSVGAAGAEQHRLGDRRHRRPHRVQDLEIGVGKALGAPIGDLVAQASDDRITADGPETRRLDFNGDAVDQFDRVAVAAPNQRSQDRHFD